MEKTVATIDSNYTQTGVPLSLNALRASSQKVDSNHKNHASPEKTHRLLVPQCRMQKYTTQVLKETIFKRKKDTERMCINSGIAIPIPL